MKIFIRKLLDVSRHIIARARRANLLLLGCSAGGFNLVYEMITEFSANFPLPVVVVIHRSRKYKSSMEELLNKKARIEVKLADDKEIIRKSTVYFAPSDYHLLLEPEGYFSLDASEPVLYSRPSIDVTFKSASDVYKESLVAILLSGANEDGAEGLCYIRNAGGLTIVQDPEIAEVRRMPEAALNLCDADLVLDNTGLFKFLAEIGRSK